MKSKNLILTLGIALLIITGGYFRFMKLDWGEGYFFHPDERNIAGAVARLKFPGQMNPHFFAYGSFPVYLYFGATKLFGKVFGNGDMFATSILIGRYLSAFFSTISIGLVFLVGQRLGKVGIFCALLLAFSPGAIQYAHFSTVESILGAMYLFVVYCAVRLWEEGGKNWIVLGGIVSGTAVATKITSVLILPIVALSILAYGLKRKVEIKKIVWEEGLFLAVAVSATLLFFPYLVLDRTGFEGGMKYESTVATGKTAVFYTKQYIGSLPFLWHFDKVLPWSLGLLATAVLPIAWAGTAGKIARNFLSGMPDGGKKWPVVFLVWLWATLYFGWHTALFVKWVRYMAPVLPVFYLLIAWFVRHGLGTAGKAGRVIAILTGVAVLSGNAWQTVKFTNIYRQRDTRVLAGEWAGNNVGRDDPILSEIYDLGVTAMPSYTMANTKLFNFYDLDLDLRDKRLEELSLSLAKSRWILVPSRRIYGSVLARPDRYPLAANYYSSLFDGSLGFEKAAEFTVKTLADARAEETYEVFDHPKVMVFKKIKLLNEHEYFELISGGANL